MHCPMRHPFDAPDPGCKLCRKAAADPAVRGWFARLASGAGPAPPAPRLRLRAVCPHEGEKLEDCKCPAGVVYECRFEGHDHDRCTRGRNNGTVASCATCPHHPEALTPVGG